MKTEMEAIGRVETARARAEDDFWGGTESCIVLSDRYPPDALDGIEVLPRGIIRQPSWPRELMSQYWEKA